MIPRLAPLAGAFGAGVRLFPMNTLGAHRIAAAGFFSFGWLMVAVASIAIAHRPEPRFPRWLATVGAATVAVFLTCIQVFSTAPLSSANRFGAPDPQPTLWWVTTLKWASIVALLVSVSRTSTTWLRYREARGAHPAA